MRKNVFLRFAGAFAFFFASSLAQGVSHPATIGQTTDSIAMQLHYPPKEKAAHNQGAVKFYCEVSPSGKATHISTLCGRKEERFGTAVKFALHHGRFNPATVEGKSTTVMLGGTVLFTIQKGQPTIAVTLVTAETDKIAAMSNYVQPQMIDSDALFRRKIYSRRDKYHFQYGAHPAAIISVEVDARGKMVGKKIESETPVNGGRGRMLLDVMDAEHFIPAQSNNQPVAGVFEIAVDFENMRDPDKGPDIGTLIQKDED